jgi:hypothetical protein
MLNRVTLASISLLALAAPARAAPPADLDACLDLSTQNAKSAGEKIKSEAEYAKFYLKQLNLNSACGTRDFAGAEKIADEMRATFHLD